MEKLNQFLKLAAVGEGTYGVVYKAKHKTTGKLVALKKIKLEREKPDFEGIPSTAIREICLLRGLRHSNVVDLLDVICVKTDLYLVFEYLDTDLKKYIDNLEDRMSEALVKCYTKQMAGAIAYLHTHLIFHRDLKPQNLLLDKEGHIKLADFGLSRSVSIPVRTYTHEVVTLWYRAPELLLGSRIYCTGIDMWSLGCIMAEMLTRTPIFPGDSEIDQLFKIFKVMGTPNERTWPGFSKLPNYAAQFPVWNQRLASEAIGEWSDDLKNFLDALLVYSPNKRLTAEHASEHVFLKDAKLTTPDLNCFSSK